ncbi:hypothetical protein KAJ87_01480 [Candidatus Pacearchaeota archaeon]|nr:hypothetical protein [Candidatus Pacearchaeota archaeon]
MFEECFKCGVSGKERKLFEVISKEGIVRICKECALEEGYPFLKQRPAKEKEEEKMREIVSNLNPSRQPKRSVIYDRLVKLSGINMEEYERDLALEKKKEYLGKQDCELKKVVDENFNLQEVSQDTSDLIHNFHWVIMRARRMKHLTAEDLAENILEPVGAINVLERGVIPKNGFRIIGKLENYLGIRIFKEQKQTSSFEEQVEPVKKDFEEGLGFNPVNAKMLTISDLKEMKEKKENEIFKKSDEFFREDFEEEGKDESS